VAETYQIPIPKREPRKEPDWDAVERRERQIVVERFLGVKLRVEEVEREVPRG